jgi:hypothetical protein
LTEGTPIFRDCLFSNVHVQADTGFSCVNADRVSFLDANIIASRGDAMTVKDSKDVRTDRLERRMR